MILSLHVLCFLILQNSQYRVSTVKCISPIRQYTQIWPHKRPLFGFSSRNWNRPILISNPLVVWIKYRSTYSTKKPQPKKKHLLHYIPFLRLRFSGSNSLTFLSYRAMACFSAARPISLLESFFSSCYNHTVSTNTNWKRKNNKSKWRKWHKRFRDGDSYGRAAGFGGLGVLERVTSHCCEKSRSEGNIGLGFWILMVLKSAEERRHGGEGLRWWKCSET